MIKKHWPLILVISIGLFLRLYKINVPLTEFYPSRQIQTADITRNFIKNDLNLLNPTVSYLGPGYKPFLIEFPGYNFVVSILYLFFGINDIFGRLFSVLGWLICSILIYKIVIRVSSKMVANIAIIFYCLSPLSVLVSRSFQPDQWMLTTSLAAIYAILLWNHKKIFYFYLSALFASVSVLIKFPSLIFTLPPIYYFVLRSRKDLFKTRNFFYLFLTLLPVVSWYLYAFIKNKSGLATEGNFLISNWFGFDVFLNPKYYSNIFGFEYNLVLLPIGIVLFLAGIFTKLKQNQKFLYYWLGGVIVYFLVFNKHNMTHEYYHLPFLPIASIFIGIAGEKMLSAIGSIIVPKKVALLGLSAVILILMIVPTEQRAYAPIDRFSSVTATANAIKKLTKPDDLIIGSMDAGPALVYYSDRHGWGFEINRKGTVKNSAFYGGTEPVDTDTTGELESLRQKGATVFASAYKNQFTENKIFSDYMRANYLVLAETENYIIFNLKKEF